MITNEELVEELTTLAADFDSLSDPARDDMLFIYKWKAPVWMTYSPFRRNRPSPERAVVIAAVLRETIKRLEA